MSKPIRIVSITGSASQPSRTAALARAIADAIGERVHVESVRELDLATLGRAFGSATRASELPLPALDALAAIGQADLLIAATPVYKGSYSGLFKHLIDFIAPDALVGRPVVLAATGGGDRHALVVEHQLRPLFGFFRAHTLPTGVYANEAELAGYAVASATLQARIDEAADQAAALFPAQQIAAVAAAIAAPAFA